VAVCCRHLLKPQAIRVTNKQKTNPILKPTPSSNSPPHRPTRYLSGFPKAAALHPFEAALLDLTVGRGMYQSVLEKVGGVGLGLEYEDWDWIGIGVGRV